MSNGAKKGTLIIIGGHEDKEGDRVILREVAQRIARGKLVIAAVASRHPDRMRDVYERLFKDLGVDNIGALNVASREDALQGVHNLDEETSAIFFTGGDQLRITSLLGGSPVCKRIEEIYEGGGLIVGTSAGASVMTETMITSGGSYGSYRLGNGLNMAPGLGFLRNVIIDQHFAERGRIGRLVAAVTHNPRILGVGIDEDTAIIVEDKMFQVLGSGCVYVLDGLGLSYSNIAEEDKDRALTAIGFKMHMLSQGDKFDLEERIVTPLPANVMEEKPRVAKPSRRTRIHVE